MSTEGGKFVVFVAFLIAALVRLEKVDAQGACTTLRREPGVCVPILTCDTITKILNLSPRPLPNSVTQLVRMSYCGNFNNVNHVCCDPNRVSGGEESRTSAQPSSPTPITPRATSSSIVQPSIDKSEEEVNSGMAILESTFCGTSDAKKVANGEDAFLQEYPWMALLVYTDGVDRTLDCGGSLITSRYVLTAAHCIRTGKTLVSVRLGEHNISTEVDCVGNGELRSCAPPIQEIDIEEAIYHKDYSRSRFSDDIGIIRLVREAEILSNVKPICLPITENAKATRLVRMIIAGWGRIETESRANVLQKAVVPIRSNGYCQQVHRVIRISDKQLCAGGGENEVDTCKGDSGGPMFFSGRYHKGVRYIQFGVVSAGSVKCGSTFPGIYVKVESYLPWIAGNIRP